MTETFTAILITGASSGLGRALALGYAAPGIRLGLHGRDSIRLEAVATACRAKGALVETGLFDVTDAAAMSAWSLDLDRRWSLDLVIANAGISGGTSGLGESLEQVRRIFAVNLDGVVNTIYPLLPAMRRRGRGRVALVSSLAGFRGLAGAPAYGASKAAIRVLGEALEAEYYGTGLGISVICPGFITTPMTARNNFTMPFLLSAEHAAAITQRGLARGQSRIGYPWPMLLLAVALASLPAALSLRLIAGLPRKPPLDATADLSG